MINEKLAYQILHNLKISDKIDFVTVKLMISDDKHYPGIKYFDISYKEPEDESDNDEIAWPLFIPVIVYTLSINYYDILRIFGKEKEPDKMRYLSNYLMREGNVLDKMLYANYDYNVENGLFNPNIAYYYPKAYYGMLNLKIDLPGQKFKKNFVELLKTIDIKATENRYVIRDLLDLY